MDSSRGTFDTRNSRSPMENIDRTQRLLPTSKRIRAFSDCLHQNRIQKIMPIKSQETLLSIVSERSTISEETLLSSNDVSLGRKLSRPFIVTLSNL